MSLLSFNSQNLRDQSQRLFDALPDHEQRLIREILRALKAHGYFGKKDFDPDTVRLSEILKHPNGRGFSSLTKITDITEGPGHYRSTIGQGFESDCTVGLGQVCATVDDVSFPATGKTCTFVFERTSAGLRVVQEKLLRQS